MRHHDFITILAGVTGGGDKEIASLHAEEGLHPHHGSALGCAQHGSYLELGVGPLHRDHCKLGTLGHGDIKVDGVMADPGQVLLAGG